MIKNKDDIVVKQTHPEQGFISGFVPELKSIEQLLFGILIEYGIPIALWSRLNGEMEMFFWGE